MAHTITLSQYLPDQIIEEQYGIYKKRLAEDLLKAILANSPAFFEQLVVDLLVKMGYGGTRQEASKALGKSGDGGVDGVISEDRLGLSNIYLQAKRYADISISRPDLQGFVGALAGNNASKGVFITTSTFTREARAYRPMNATIRLIDGNELTQLMIEFGLGTKTEKIIHLLELDNDYWEA